jgi:hypothetical protein
VDRRAQVVRHEERRERDHDQVVEKENPAGHEAGEVVERAPDERRGAAGLRERRGRLGVGDGDEQEQQAGDEQHERREAERVQRDHAEREVDRGRDLAVGDREQRPRVELAPQAGELARHLAAPLQVEPPGAGRDEEHAEQEPDPAAARERDDEDHDAEPDRDEREEQAEAAIRVHAAVPSGHVRCQAHRRKCDRSVTEVSTACIYGVG